MALLAFLEHPEKLVILPIDNCFGGDEEFPIELERTGGVPAVSVKAGEPWRN